MADAVEFSTATIEMCCCFVCGVVLPNSWFPQPKKYYFPGTFPGQNHHFPGQTTQDLKITNQDMCENAYPI